MVALLAEGVDRNFDSKGNARALAVALLAEGVDRNSIFPSLKPIRRKSPSSRRAWIEIFRNALGSSYRMGSPSSRRAWIEIGCWP